MRYRIYIVYYIVPYKLYEYNIYVERFFLLYIHHWRTNTSQLFGGSAYANPGVGWTEKNKQDEKKTGVKQYKS